MSLDQRTNSFDKNSDERCISMTANTQNRSRRISADSVKRNDQKRLIIASFLCLGIMIAEMIGGILSNSLAVMTDSAHLFTDFGAFMVSLLAIWISGKSRNETMNFGYHRAEVIGALISVLFIWLMTGILIYMAIYRVIYPNYTINAELMMIVALLAISANLLLVCALSCDKMFENCKKGKIIPRKFGINVYSALIHVIGDVLHSLGVVTASLIIYFKPEHKIADPICTFIFSIIVLATTVKIMKDVLRVLMEGSPSHITFRDIRETLLDMPEVLKVHNLRMWSLTMDKVALSTHIVTKSGENTTKVLKKAFAEISNKFDIYEITIQIEEAESSSENSNKET